MTRILARERRKVLITVVFVLVCFVSSALSEGIQGVLASRVVLLRSDEERIDLRCGVLIMTTASRALDRNFRSTGEVSFLVICWKSLTRTARCLIPEWIKSVFMP